ncbi:MAG TPA: hypothetical protein VMZ27_13840 [Candidatus Saccharimonadales bacterium]|nr:hypothetical protein [Candidatus Saccharimonadales bacterium]
MKKFIIMALSLCCATSITLSAAEGKKKELTDDQKKLQKEMLEKYDANKDGKLDKEERSKISADDKKKMSEAGIGGGRKKAQ